MVSLPADNESLINESEFEEENPLAFNDIEEGE